MTRIPKTVHYVFGMASDFGGKPWGLVHHACLMSAVRHLRPSRILMHCAFEPSGLWWDLSRPYFDVNVIEAPTEIHGKPLIHVAHRAGVTRLRALIDHGGIYLDADVLVQRDFDDLLDFPAVLGREGKDINYGTADAVILAERNSTFLARWLEEYRWFRSTGQDQYWAEHAVEVPSRLAVEHPAEVHVLPHTAFFWPLWTDDHLRWMYRSTAPIPAGAYANHLWESLAYDYFKNLTPGRVRRIDSNFHRWLAPHLADLPDGFGSSDITWLNDLRFRWNRLRFNLEEERRLRRKKTWR